jgi:hypothetical protein
MKQGTYVHQAKYMKNLMKKFNMAELNPVSTPMSMATMLDPDENGDAVDQREYRSSHDDMAGQSVFHVLVFTLSSIPTLFTSDNHSADS